MKTCPKCKLVNTNEIRVCSCGYNIAAEPVGPPESAAQRFGKSAPVQLVLRILVSLPLVFAILAILRSCQDGSDQ